MMLLSFAGLVVWRFAEADDVLTFTCATTRSGNFTLGANTP